MCELESEDNDSGVLRLAKGTARQIVAVFPQSPEKSVAAIERIHNLKAGHMQIQPRSARREPRRRVLAAAR